jgi:hypothetical protein
VEHPFLDHNEIAKLQLDEIQSKISDILGKLNFANQTGNYQLSNQLQMVLETHNEALRLHFDEINKNADSDYADKINIS